MERFFFSVVILFLIGLFIYREWTRPTIEHPDPEIIVEQIFDTIYVEIDVPRPYVVHVIDTVEIPVEVFPEEILHDYFKVKVYQDTLVNDSSLFFRVNDTIHQNILWSRSFTYKNRRPAQTIVHVPSMPLPKPKPDRHRWFIGGGVLGSPTQFGASVGAGMLTENMGLYTYQFDVINKTHNISMYWNINFNLP